MTPEEAKKLEAWAANLFADPERKVSADEYDKWEDWAKTFYADDPERYEYAKAHAHQFALRQTEKREKERLANNNQPSVVTNGNTNNNQPSASTQKTQTKPTKYTPSVQSMNGIKVSKLPTHSDAYEELKTVTNQPSVETKTTQFGLPDAQTQEYIRRNVIEPLQRAYGVNPQTGAITPFEALGYNPEDERKRREAERALNDRKRKENAWYNAFAVLGDSLTAALGGNVWQRQPNNIGAKANADNARLIAEQKAEDEANAAKLRAAGTSYANMVNQLIQNYLTKTTTTNKTGGDSVESTIHPEQNGYKYVSNVERENNDGGGSVGGKRGGGSGSWKNNAIYQIGLKHNGKVQYRDITGQQAKNIVEHAETLYEKALRNGDDATRKAILDLLGTNIVRGDKDGNYVWNDEALLRSGYIFEADKVFPNGILQGVDESIRDYYRRITGDETDYNETPNWDLVTPAVRQAAENKDRNLKAPWLQLQTNNSNKAPWLK